MSDGAKRLVVAVRTPDSYLEGTGLEPWCADSLSGRGFFVVVLSNSMEIPKPEKKLYDHLFHVFAISEL